MSGSMSGSVPDATAIEGGRGWAMAVPRRVVIELDAGPDPIAGLLLMDGCNSSRRFEGYTQLIAALEAARDAAPEALLEEEDAR
jgi:hypothetical protein